MKLNDILRRSVGYYRAGTSLHLTSAPGRGKTTTVRDAAARIGKALDTSFGFVLLSGPLLNPPDTVGYLIPGRTAQGVAISEFTKPFWWFTDEGKSLDQYEGGIVFVDEADKMDVDMKKVIGEMALSGRFGPHKLPKGWVVWSAGNRSSDRSGATKELDHLINRRKQIEVTDDLQAWDDWASENGVHPVVRTFANQNPQIVFSEGVPDKQGPWCTPRSLVMCGNDLVQFANDDGTLPIDPLAKEDAAGMIGPGAAAQLFAMIQLEHEMPRYHAIIQDPKGAKLPSKPDAQMLVAYTLAARVTENELAPVVSYIDRMPKEFSVLFAKSACRRDPELVNTAVFGDWAVKNASLMQAIRDRA